MVEGPPADAGDGGSTPGPGGSHMSRSAWAHAPQLLSPCAGVGGGRRDERSAHRGGEWPPLAATGGSPRAATKTQRSQK